MVPVTLLDKEVGGGSRQNTSTGTGIGERGKQWRWRAVPPESVRKSSSGRLYWIPGLFHPKFESHIEFYFLFTVWGYGSRRGPKCVTVHLPCWELNVKETREGAPPGGSSGSNRAVVHISSHSWDNLLGPGRRRQFDQSEGEITISPPRAASSGLGLTAWRGRVHYLALDGFTSHFNSINIDCSVLTRVMCYQKQLRNKIKVKCQNLGLRFHKCSKNFSGCGVGGWHWKLM